MADEVLTKIAEDFKKANEEIPKIESYISAMSDAGEDTSQLRADLRNLRIKTDKWSAMLKSRGYDVGEFGNGT